MSLQITFAAAKVKLFFDICKREGDFSGKSCVSEMLRSSRGMHILGCVHPEVRLYRGPSQPPSRRVLRRCALSIIASNILISLRSNDYCLRQLSNPFEGLLTPLLGGFSAASLCRLLQAIFLSRFARTINAEQSSPRRLLSAVIEDFCVLAVKRNKLQKK